MFSLRNIYYNVDKMELTDEQIKYLANLSVNNIERVKAFEEYKEGWLDVGVEEYNEFVEELEQIHKFKKYRDKNIWDTYTSGLYDDFFEWYAFNYNLNIKTVKKVIENKLCGAR